MRHRHPLITIGSTVFEAAAALVAFLVGIALTRIVLGSRWDSPECDGMCFGDAVAVFLVSLIPGGLLAWLAVVLARRFVTRPLAARLSKTP